jgi:hypothetical protein
MYARAYPSHPHTACTVLHTRKQCVSYSPHGEPAELQGYPVNATKSPVNAAIRSAWYVQYGVASRMSIALPRFQYLYSQVLEDRGGTNSNVGGSLAKQQIGPKIKYYSTRAFMASCGGKGGG